ncbi:MAG: DUF1571 domain-containing protein [Planctomycetales bacterium]|nr:DUF1571 domain-containing protein [Planctomycetales bacterium]
MKTQNSRRNFLLALAAAGTSFAAGQIFAQEAKLKEPVFRVAAATTNIAIPEAAAGEHPLDPALRFADDNLKRFQADIKDYKCLIVKRERIRGVLNEYEYMYAKIRNHKEEGGKISSPLSVYLNFQKPANVAGREVIWVEGANNGKLCAHEGGLLGKLPAVWLDPKGPMAMRGNLYPITEIGIENLIAKLIERGSRERAADPKGEATVVTTTKGAKLGSGANKRPCTILQISHPTDIGGFEFKLAQIFIDDEYNFPVRYIAYGWPVKGQKGDVILEEYNYTNIELNVGLTDSDFEPSNPSYKFRGVGNPAIPVDEQAAARTRDAEEKKKK